MRIEVPAFNFAGEEITLVGELVDVAPHCAAATWIIHREVPAGCDGWVVSNVETGYRIGHSVAETKAESIELARKFLASKSSELIESRMEIARAHGFKPDKQYR